MLARSHGRLPWQFRPPSPQTSHIPPGRDHVPPWLAPRSRTASHPPLFNLNATRTRVAARLMKHFATALFLSLTLAACGGGGGDTSSDGKNSSTGSSGNGGNPSAANLVAGNGSPCAPNLCVNFGYPTVSAVRLLTGSVNVTDTSALTGHAPRYSVVGGTLPPGMSLDALTGSIAGTPTTNGVYTATIALGVQGFTGSLSTTVGIEVIDPKLSFSQGSTPIVAGAVDSTQFAPFYLSGTALSGQALSLHGPDLGGATLAAGAGLAGRVVYSVTGTVPLPPGLSLDAATGAITGTPTQAGVWITQVKAVVTTGAETDTFDGYAAIAVGALVQETRGAPAAAPVQLAVHVDPSVALNSSLVLGAGSSATTLTYDATSQQLTLTPAAVSADATPGSYMGATRFLFTAPDGSQAVAGYVEVVQ